MIVGSEYVGRRGLVKESCGVTDSGTGMIDTVWWPKVGSVFFFGNKGRTEVCLDANVEVSGCHAKG